MQLPQRKSWWNKIESEICALEMPLDGVDGTAGGISLSGRSKKMRIIVISIGNNPIFAPHLK